MNKLRARGGSGARALQNLPAHWSSALNAKRRGVRNASPLWPRSHLHEKGVSAYAGRMMNFATAALPRFFCLAALLSSMTGLRAEEHATFTVGEFTFSRPAKWESVQSTSQMRKAQLKLTGQRPIIGKGKVRAVRVSRHLQ